MSENVKFDVQSSIFNGLKDYRGVEEFLIDLRAVLIKHNIKFIRSDFMELNDNKELVVRKSEFLGNEIVAPSYENRKEIGSNILYSKQNEKDFENLYKNEGMAIFIKGQMTIGIHPDNLENNLKSLANGDMKFDWGVIKDRHIK